MPWPHVVKLTTSCPSCGATAGLEVIHQPFQRLYGIGARIYRSFTWADCPACGHEWPLDSSIARGALPAA